jgi:hypothetical protein
MELAEESRGLDHGGLDLDHVEPLDRVAGDCPGRDAAAQSYHQHPLRVRVEQQGEMAGHELGRHVSRGPGVELAVDAQEEVLAGLADGDGGRESVAVVDDPLAPQEGC